MAFAPAESDRLERRAMSREEFDALPHGVRAEYAGGQAVVTPPASHVHNYVVARLARLLDDALDGLFAVHDAGLELPGSLRIPDIAVVRALAPNAWAAEPPVLVVEVLSRATRSEDTLRKPAEYLAGGVEQQWLVDRSAGSMTVLIAAGGEWTIAHELDDDHPTAEVVVAEHGTVTIDIRALVPPELRD